MYDLSIYMYTSELEYCTKLYHYVALCIFDYGLYYTDEMEL